MFGHIRSTLVMAQHCKKPVEAEMVAIGEPFNQGILAISRFKNQRRSEWDNHISMIAESAMAVTWPLVPVCIGQCKLRGLLNNSLC